MTSPSRSVLTSSPGITIRSRPRASSTVSSAPPKTLWSVTAIAPRPSRLGVRHEVGRLDRAVVRVARVHVQVDDDQVAVRERLRLVPSCGSPAARRVGVEAIEPLGDVVERAAGDGRAPCERRPSLAPSRPRRSGAAPRPRARAGSRRPEGRRSRSPRPRPRHAGVQGRRARERRSPPCGGSAARASPVRPVRTWTRSRRRIGIDGRAASRAVRSTIASQPSRPAQRAQGGADDREPARRGLDHDAASLFAAGAKSSRSMPGRDDRECAGETLAGARRDLVVRREQGVDPREQTVALRLPRREPEAARGRRRSPRWSSPPRAARRTRGRERPGRSRGRRRSRRCGGPSRRSRGRRWGFRRRPRRDRDGTGQRDDAVEHARLQRSAAREEVGGAGRRREHDDRVTASRRASATPATCSFVS